uniref:Uncharacterized protein n=1 Tax=Triticum urartu TaxID=4572 RepID=A0A8R7TFQ1_TRIUA
MIEEIQQTSKGWGGGRGDREHGADLAAWSRRRERAAAARRHQHHVQTAACP